MNNEILARAVFERISSAMDSLAGRHGRPLRWFHAFGTMLEYVADRTFSIDAYDIDIGVFFQELDEDMLQKAFDALGYKVSTSIKNDKDGRPLNIHCVPAESRLHGTPTVDIYAFYPRGGDYLYTYDYNREGKKVPSKYVFKKTRKELLEPAPETIARIRGAAHPEASRLLGEDGIWRYDVFEDHGPYKMRIPFAYGTLLDQWYPGWRFRQYFRGQSQSPDGKVVVKSCEDL